MDDSTLRRLLATEIALSDALLKTSVNLAIQLGLADGGDMTTVRAVMAAMEERLMSDDTPPIPNLENHGGIEKPDKGDLVDRWVNFRKTLLMQSTIAVQKVNSIPPTRQ